MRTLLSEDHEKKKVTIIVEEADIITVSRGANDIGRLLVEKGARKVTEGEFYGIIQLEEADALTSRSECLGRYKKNHLGGYKYVTHVGGGYFDTDIPYERAKISVYHDAQNTYAIQTKTRMKGAPVERDSHLIIEVSSLDEGKALEGAKFLKEFLTKNYSVLFEESQPNST